MRARHLLLLATLAACQAADAKPEPPISITTLGPGRFVISARETTKLDIKATLERLDNGKWVPASDYFDINQGYRLVSTCDAVQSKSPTFVELEAGKTLAPVAWTGMNCSAQCNMSCRANSYEPGTWHLVVRTFDGTRTFTGDSFVMQDYDAPPWVRNGLVTDVASATIGGRSLDKAEVAAVVAALSDAKGFTYGERHRCKEDHAVTVVLHRAVGAVTEDVNLTFDFGCQGVALEYHDGTRALTEAALFTKRATWVALAKQLLPGHPNVEKLK